MNVDTLKSFRQQSKALILRIRSIFLPGTLPDSVYFFTFHKCVSSMFARYALKNMIDLCHIDYAQKIYYGEAITDIDFRKKGCIYGPIRLSADSESLVYEKLVRPVANSEFIRDKKVIFFVRDPRDMLVSAYYSFGYSHGLSPVNEIRELQETQRKAIREKTLEEYVLDAAPVIAQNFRTVSDLRKSCRHSAVLKYEDMIECFDAFINQLSEIVPLEDYVVRAIYEQTRPREVEDVSSHRRSGQVAGFRDKLDENTIESLNELLRDVLVEFGYPV
jgi:hypothetical protein